MGSMGTHSREEINEEVRQRGKDIDDHNKDIKERIARFNKERQQLFEDETRKTKEKHCWR